MRVHAFRTALMKTKRRYYDARGENRLVRLTSALLDSEWVQLPVFAWVIEHPEGVIVIDTGETAQVHDPNYFPLYQRPYWTSQYRFIIRPEDELGAQMRQAGISPEDVRWLVLTHTHFDHTDGINHFPNAEILLSHKEHEETFRSRSMHFAFPAYWQNKANLKPIDYLPERLGAFDQSYPLTKAGDVRIVPTPGHTLGHQSVILQDEGLTYFFGGDTSFDLLSLVNGTLDAPAEDAPLTRRTRQQILDFALDTPTVYLTTHDLETGRRLQQRTTLYQEKHAALLSQQPGQQIQPMKERASRVYHRMAPDS